VDHAPRDERAIETISAFRALGGIQAIAISHPHYYGTMVEWSRAFGDAPINLHEQDKGWVVRSTDALQFWQGATKSLFGGVELVRCGGHFDGYQVAHWKDLLFAGDQPQVAMDQRGVSFLYSYPNMIPLHV
jgi:glyoxylase-like metal-dependent hydrolase (beta-lactamase superfamily II)